MAYRLFFILVCTLAFFVMKTRAADIVIEHVNVITMNNNNDVLTDINVIVEHGRIVGLGKEPVKTIIVGTRVDGRGKWLIPGLMDMHVHVENHRLGRLMLGQSLSKELADRTFTPGAVDTADTLLPYIANGVCQITVLGAMAETIAQKLEVDSGKVLGPHMALAAMIDGNPPLLPVGVTRVAATPADGRQAVRDAAAEGYELIKVYSQLDLPTFIAIVDEAQKHALKVVGHLPLRQKNLTDKFFIPGFGLVAHAEEFAQQTVIPDLGRIPDYVKMAKRSNTGLITTLSLDNRILEQASAPVNLNNRPEVAYLPQMLQTMLIQQNPYMRYNSPQSLDYFKKVVAFNEKLVAEFHKAGVSILAGTDALNPGVVPGFSLHDELEAINRAGLSPLDVLASATRIPAQWLGVYADRGDISIGKRADMVLLTANPLDDIRNSRKIGAVVINGNYYLKNVLDKKMEELKKRRAQP